MQHTPVYTSLLRYTLVYTSILQYRPTYPSTHQSNSAIHQFILSVYIRILGYAWVYTVYTDMYIFVCRCISCSAWSLNMQKYNTCMLAIISYIKISIHFYTSIHNKIFLESQFLIILLLIFSLNSARKTI